MKMREKSKNALFSLLHEQAERFLCLLPLQRESSSNSLWLFVVIEKGSPVSLYCRSPNAQPLDQGR